MPRRGEVRLVDFGVTQKVRPALVMSIPSSDNDRALIGVVPPTTSLRGSQFAVPLPRRFLEVGAFMVHGLQPMPPKNFLRRLGALPQSQLAVVEDALLHWQGITLGQQLGGTPP